MTNLSSCHKAPVHTVCDPPSGLTEAEAKKKGYPCRYWYECEKCGNPCGLYCELCEKAKKKHPPNGFTPEQEQEILREEKEAMEGLPEEEKCPCYKGTPHVCKDGEALLNDASWCPCFCHKELPENENESCKRLGDKLLDCATGYFPENELPEEEMDAIGIVLDAVAAGEVQSITRELMIPICKLVRSLRSENSKLREDHERMVKFIVLIRDWHDADKLQPKPHKIYYDADDVLRSLHFSPKL